MIIAIDTLPSGTAGGRTYAEILLNNLLEIDRRNRYLVFVDIDRLSGFPKIFENLRIMPVRFGSQSTFRRLIWQQLLLPNLLRGEQVDLLYTLGGIDIFAAPCKTVIKIENMAPYYEEIVSAAHMRVRARLILLNLLTKLSARTASGILTMSKTAERELIDSGFPECKMRAIMHSADLANLKAKPVSQNKYDMKEGFILSVSHIDQYKNLLELVQAYGFLKCKKDDIPPLVIAGRARDKRYHERLVKLVEECGLRNDVLLLGNIPRGSLHYLYDRCLFLVFTSKVETCPRTLIEAMKWGIPIACSDRSVMPEICEDAALYFDPDNSEEMALRIRQLLESPELRSEMRHRSLARGRFFCWGRTARKTLEFFEEIVK